jgi:hypothetical protein
VNNELDFRLHDHGSFYTLDPLTEVGKQFIESEGIGHLRFTHDNWLRVAVELNKHGFTVKVD